jgi:hypothetical protein
VYTVGSEEVCRSAFWAQAISWLSLATFCFSSLMYSDASMIMDVSLSCVHRTQFIQKAGQEMKERR